MNEHSYLTVAGTATAELEVKRSRFLATLARVGDEESARSVVDQLRTRHWDARHHCSAFILGPPPQPVERSSDDGEPAGTAGAPMLEVLRGYDDEGLSDVVAVVTRWFGGTLLGAGGLVRAYSDAVREAIGAATVLRRNLVREFDVALGHDVAGRVEAELRSHGFAVTGTEYGADGVRLTLGVAPDEVARLETELAALTAGTAHPEPAGDRWVDG